jgi:catechol-2,3-dioxygenase
MNPTGWRFRSLLLGVSDLASSISFYREVMHLRDVLRSQDMAVLTFDERGTRSLYLRQVRNAVHHESALGIQGLVCEVNSRNELDEVEDNLRTHDGFIHRSQLTGAIDLIHGRDPDRIPLAFLVYDLDERLTSGEYRLITEKMYGFHDT